MTLREVAIKNIRHNKSIYSAFFFASALSIYMFFLLLSLVMNKDFIKAVLSETVTGIFSAVLLVIGLFSMVFIPYCYRSLIIARSKDYGLYMLMGISKKQLRKIVATESIFFSGISLIIGLGLGALSSYYYYLIALKITGISIEQAPFHLNFLMFIYTGALFVAIFIIATLITIGDLNRRELIYFIKLAKRKRTGNEKGTILGTIGFLIVIFSILLSGYVMFISRGSNCGYIYTFSIITCLIGFYLALGNYGFVVMKICKGRKAYYLKNLLHLSQISYRFSDYKFVIFSVSMLSALVVFFSSLITGFILGEKHHFNIINPYDLEINYSEDNSLNIEFDNIIEKNREKISYSFQYEKLHFYDVNADSDIWKQMKIIDLPTAEELIEKKIEIKDWETVYLRNNTTKPDSNFWIQKDAEITLKSGFTMVVDHIIARPFSGFGPDHIVVTKNTFNQLMDLSDKKTKHKMINFHNPKDGLDIFHKLFEKIPENESIQISEIFSYDEIFSREHYRIIVKGEKSIMVFGFGYVALLFIVATGCVLYFKIMMDREQYREQFKKLDKIGLTSNEYKTFLGKSLRPLFMLPSIFGGFLGGFYLITLMTVESFFLRYIVLGIIIVISSFVLLNYLFYFFCRQNIIMGLNFRS